MFWIVTAGLFLLAALFVVGPLWLRASSQPADSVELRKQANIALFQERSDELEAELSAGNLDQRQFDLLLSELQLGLLALLVQPLRYAAMEVKSTLKFLQR